MSVRKIKIGSVELENNAFLAPMAGVCDHTFRLICKKYGAGLVYSEMISAKALSFDDRKTKALAEHEGEGKIAIQIFGHDPECMADAAKRMEQEFGADIIDINMGCPAPKIAGNGGGASLMKNPQLAEDIVRGVVKASPVPVTVKIRMGWDFDSINAVELAKRAENAGAAAITVHGRTKSQMYAPPVNREIIAEVKRAVSIPVIGNGDITDGFSAAKMLEETNCDLVMVGRGALGRPWVFSQINAYLEHGRILPEPPVAERMRVMVNHIKTICEYKGEYVGLREARKHAAWYTKGLHGAAEYRREIGSLSSIEQLEEIAYKICIHNG